MTYTLLGAFASVVFCACGTTILRGMGAAYFGSLPTGLLRFFSMILVHAVPFFMLKWYWAIGLIVGGQIVGKFLAKKMLAPYVSSAGWPENVKGIVGIVPTVCHIASLAIAALVLVNAI